MGFDYVRLIDTLETIYSFMIIGYILLSWLPNARESFIGEFLGKLVEPYLSIFRRFIPPIGGMLDISPIVALFALRFVAYGLIGVLDFLIGR
ncbi:YggT family protein [Paenibacillus sp. FSL W8-1187]|uniref:YggT family protein n=2 Tax=Paenibacillus TaxID=44249 RepID=A0A6H2GYG8_9BACL|nr:MULTISPECIES: YggT family protein [Paenibacillus]PLT46454.1 Integral membrane protein YggT, involved in response to extracytoplasmic stress (osmotic shock) [Paenibacillus pasadenensis]QJC52483.1 YggT family protein [Paenibacillus albicereus]